MKKFFTTLTPMAALIAWLGLVSGCSTARKNSDPDSALTAPSDWSPESVLQQQYGPPVPALGEGPEPSYGPDPIQLRAVVLVLGPGMARGYAHAGVVRALADAKIPIAAIVSAEMGSLIGSAYALEGSANQLDWALLRLKDKAFDDSKRWLNRLMPNTDGPVDSELGEIFGKKDVSDSKIPIRIGFRLDSPGGDLALVDRGKIREAVRASLAVPGLLGPGSWDGMKALSIGKQSLPFLVGQAKALSLGPVVVVDVQGIKGPIADADLVIQPDLNGIGEQDFQRRSEAVFRGKQAVLKQIRQVRSWVGLPQEEQQ